MLSSIFEQKKVSTAQMISFLPKEKRQGAAFTTTLGILTQFFNEHGVMMMYVTKEKITSRIENLRPVRPPTPVIPTVDPEVDLLTRTRTPKHRTVAPEPRKTKVEESVDFNQLETYVETFFSQEVSTAPEEVLIPDYNWYLESIVHHPILNKDITYKLIAEAQRGNIDARNYLVMHNQRLVIHMAKRYKARLAVAEALEFPDLIQEGTLGLCKGIEKFDMSLGLSLSTYALWWIQQGITRALDDFGLTVRLPVHTQEKLRKFRKIYALIEIRSGEKPEITEIAEEMKIEVDEAQDLAFLNLSRSRVSLDSPFGDDGEDSDARGYADLLPDKTTLSAATLVDRKILQEKVRKYLKANLTIREYQIMDKRFGLSNNRPMTLEEVGEEFEVTRERIRQIESKAYEKVMGDVEFQKFAAQYLDREINVPQGASTPKRPVAGDAHWRVLKSDMDKSVASEVIMIVRKFYGVSIAEMYERATRGEVARARNIAMFVMWKYYGVAFNMISRKFEDMSIADIKAICNNFDKEVREKMAFADEIGFLVELVQISRSEFAKRN